MAEPQAAQSLAVAEIQAERNRLVLHTLPCLVEVSEEGLQVLVAVESVQDLAVAHLVGNLVVVVVHTVAFR